MILYILTGWLIIIKFYRCISIFLYCAACEHMGAIKSVQLKSKSLKLICGHRLGKDWPLGSLVFPRIVSCVWYGIWLYGFLIFVFFLLLLQKNLCKFKSICIIHTCIIISVVKNSWYKPFKNVNSNYSCTVWFKNLGFWVWCFAVIINLSYVFNVWLYVHVDGLVIFRKIQ